MASSRITGPLREVLARGDFRALVRVLGDQPFQQRIGPLMRQYPELGFGEASTLASRIGQAVAARTALQAAGQPGEQLRLKDFPIVPGAVAAEQPGARLAIDVESVVQAPFQRARAGPGITLFASTLEQAEAMLEKLRAAVAEEFTGRSPTVFGTAGLEGRLDISSVRFHIAAGWRDF